MKTPIVTVIALACAGFSSLYGEVAGEAEGVKHRITRAELAKRMQARPNPLEMSRGVEPVTRDSLGEKKQSRKLGGLVQRSTILAHGGHWTFVPRGSVLHVPPAYQSRLKARPAGKLLPWADFYARNRGWIMTQAVAITNARGEEALGEEVLENHQKVGRIVVAVLHNGPISVKAPVPPKDQETTLNSTTTKR